MTGVQTCALPIYGAVYDRIQTIGLVIGGGGGRFGEAVAITEKDVDDGTGVGLLFIGQPGLEGAASFARRLWVALDEGLPDVERVLLPYRWSSTKRRGWYDARGNYANFLMTANRVYLPVYGVEQDERALQLFEELFPGRVSTIDARVIAAYGGSLHCITWNHASGR